MDLKEMYMERADELAMELYDKEFYELTESQRDTLYAKAEMDVVDGCADHADFLRKADKERQE